VAPPLPPLAQPSEPGVIVTPPPASPPIRPVFVGDRRDTPDVLNFAPTLDLIAALAAHRGTQTPVTIALLGPAGSGKSFALRQIGARIAQLASSAAAPFVSKIHVQSIDAAALDGDPGLAVAARLYAGLRQTYPEFAGELGTAAQDPHVALREADEKLDEARRRLDSERRALEEAGARRARLTETVLYESAGSQVDSYVRANRPMIESRLRSFGIAGGDAVRSYKDLVQLVARSGGKTSLVLRSFWAFKGQTKLIVTAILLLLAAWGLGLAVDQQDVWLADLRGGPKAGAALADWFATHMSLLSHAQTAAVVLALAALIANGVRAVAFLRPVFRGAQLLDSDLDNRRRDLDGLYAHETKRVDSLERDVERLTRNLAEAERRASESQGSALNVASPFGSDGPHAPDVFDFLSRRLNAASPSTAVGTAYPQRILLAIDNLDCIPPERARAVLDALHRLGGPGFVTIAAADLARLDPKALRRNELERWIEVPVRLDALGASTDRDALVRAALGEAAASAEGNKSDSPRPDLDAPLDEDEKALLAALTDLAGQTPRAVKRFVNLYRIARLASDRSRAPLAFMLAVQGGSEADRKMVAEALVGEPGAAFDLPRAEPRLRAAYDAMVAAGGRVSLGDAAEAARRAAVFALS
jgi:hypothetical protein